MSDVGFFFSPPYLSKPEMERCTQLFVCFSPILCNVLNGIFHPGI